MWFKTDDLEYDEYEDVWFDAGHDNCIITKDDHYYATACSAEDAGYMQNENGEWVLSEVVA